MLRLSIRGFRPAPLFAALAGALLLSACATDYGPPINGERALSPEEQRLQAVENRTVDLGRRMSALEAAQQGGANADEIRSLRGQVEQLRYDLDNAIQKNQQEQADLDARLKRLEGGAPPPADNGGQPPPGTAMAPPSVAPPAVAMPPPGAQAVAPVSAGGSSSAGAEEESIYLGAFDQLKGGHYDEAIRGFRAMLEKYPHGNYADNALFYSGQCYQIKGDSASALKAYQTLLQSLPASPKVPDALLKTGVIYEEQQKTPQAREAYTKILKQYPTSNAATQARSRLAKLH